MSDQRFGSGEMAETLRALGLPREVRAESPIPAEVRAALGLPAWAPGEETLPTATACFELHIGNVTSAPLVARVPVPPPQVVIPFQVTVDLTATPYAVLSGTFIFDSPEVTGWRITQGNFGLGLWHTPSLPPVLADELSIVGEYIHTSEVAEAEAADGLFVPPSVLITGTRLVPPLSYPGFFFSEAIYNANTLFRGWQACS